MAKLDAPGPALNAQIWPDISTRFVPDGLHWDGTAWQLRGALVLLPTEAEVPISRWTQLVDESLSSGVSLLIAPDPGLGDWGGDGSQPVRARALYDRSSGAIQAALWQALMNPHPKTRVRADVLAVLEEYRRLPEMRASMSTLGMVPGSGKKFGVRPGFGADALHHPTNGMAAFSSDAIRVNRAGTAALASALVQSGGAHLNNGLNDAISAARVLGRAGTMTITREAVPALANVNALFTGALENSEPNTNKTKLSSTDFALSLGTRLGGRGAAAAAHAESRQHSLAIAQEAQNPMHRVPLIRGPEVRATKAIVNGLASILNNDERHAHAVAAKLRAMSEQPSAPPITPIEALLRHMMVLCSDPPVDGPTLEYLDAKKSRQPIRPFEVVAMYRALRGLTDQRVSGLLSYPSLARALRLVVDVEIQLGLLPPWVQKGRTAEARFLVAAAFGSSDRAKLWSRCQLTAGRFTLVGEDELAGARREKSEHVAGVYNLGCRTDSGTGEVARFQATSVDVVAKAEQLIAKAKSDVAKISSGGNVDDGSGNTRTVGVSILDENRATAVQREAKRAQELQGKIGTASDVIVLQAEDLTAGICLDVGVVRKDGRGRAWRSLSRRRLRFGKVKTSAGSIDVEKIVEQAIKAAAPRLNGVPQTDAFRDRLEECSYSASSRVSATKPTRFDQDVDDAAAIALETIGHWEGDPLGAPALQPGADATQVDTADGSAPHETLLDEVLTMPIGIELDVPSDSPGRTPPRIEIGRQFSFAARASYLGGLGLPPEGLDALHGPDNNPFILPLGHTGSLERHERIGAPMLAEIFPVEPKGASDSQVHLIVRSGGGPFETRNVARRIFLAPRVHQAFAAMHQHPNFPGKRALDTGLLVGGRAAGGLVNAAVDPANGGLQVLYRGEVMPRSKVEALDETSRAIASKEEKPRHEQPTHPPAMGVFKVTETGFDDIKARREQYFPDPMASRFAVQLWTQGTTARPLDKPTLVKIYDDHYRIDIPSDWNVPDGFDRSIYPFAMPLVVETMKGSTLGVEDAETGYVDDEGAFNTLRPGQAAPIGTVTCQRVRVTLPPTAEVDLKVWCVPGKQALPWLSAVNEVVATTPGRSIDGIHATLCLVPVPDIAEIRTVSLVHTVERPAPPAIEHLDLVRVDLSEEAWTRLADKPDFRVASLASSPHASTTWIGGTYTVDPAAGDITIGVSFHDVRDIPGLPITLDDQGNPTFDWKASEPIARPLEQTDANALAPTIAVPLEASDGRPRNISLKAFDTRSYRIRLAPTSRSRFVNQITENPGNLERFTSYGPVKEAVILATDRPAPMGRVRMLPAFVWTEKQNGVVRRAVVRLSWRRPPVSGEAQAQAADTAGCWYSSGEGELLGVVLAAEGRVADDYGPQRGYISTWGADPIRSNVDRADRPVEGFGLQNIVMHDRTPVRADMPPLTNPEDAGLHRAVEEFQTTVDLATYVPLYDPLQDAWWVDVDIEPGRVATPYVRLGLVRYQPNAIEGMHVSQPTHIGFALVPKRSVDVAVLPKDKSTKRWPVRVVVRGRFGVVDGGSGGNVSTLERITGATRPTFKLTIFKDRSIFGGGEEPIVQTNSDGAAAPSGDVLWDTTVFLPHNPRGVRHHVFVEEVDVMQPANPELHEGGAQIETGPRFMARVRIQ